jgi:D-alanyl-D-alanine dipeptidase
VKWILYSFFSLNAFANPPELVDLAQINEKILIEIRYNTDWNFVGRKVRGYQSNSCFLTKFAAENLSKVQREVEKQGYSLLVFDCYRPQVAVDELLQWTQVPEDQKMKAIFYPNELKGKLVERGYIAEKSGHTLGHTVDLTLVKISNLPKVPPHGELRFREKAEDCRRPSEIEKTGQLDMGTLFDCFDELANTANPKISKKATNNRQYLKAVMARFGFKNYSKEWWHFALKP